MSIAVTKKSQNCKIYDTKNGLPPKNSPFPCFSKSLCLFDSLYRTSGRAGTAVDASVSVDLEVLIALADSANGASSLAASAGYARVCDLKCHSRIPPYLIAVLEKPGLYSHYSTNAGKFQVVFQKILFIIMLIKYEKSYQSSSLSSSGSWGSW